MIRHRLAQDPLHHCQVLAVVVRLEESVALKKSFFSVLKSFLSANINKYKVKLGYNEQLGTGHFSSL
jgi:hypothetical protein